MKRESITLTLVLAVLLAVPAFGATITVDEFGRGLPFRIGNDSGPGGLNNVLIYTLPFVGVQGDVLLNDPGIGVLDVIRFNGDSMIFYSDNIGGFDAPGDTPGPPRYALYQPRHRQRNWSRRQQQRELYAHCEPTWIQCLCPNLHFRQRWTNSGTGYGALTWRWIDQLGSCVPSSPTVIADRDALFSKVEEAQRGIVSPGRATYSTRSVASDLAGEGQKEKRALLLKAIRDLALMLPRV